MCNTQSVKNKCGSSIHYLLEHCLVLTMAVPFAPRGDDDFMGCGSAPKQRTGDDVKYDWKKLIIQPAESDLMLEELRNGHCNCEEMDDKPCDSVRHPLSRLHYEQLQRQRPRSKHLKGESDAPHMRYEAEYEEERFRKNSKKYAYKMKYTCTKCGSEWEVIHDWWWTDGSGEDPTGHSSHMDSLMESFKATRTVAGAGIF